MTVYVLISVLFECVITEYIVTILSDVLNY